MFDLEAAITQWKESFGTNDSVGSDDIFELETHLRESTALLAKGYLNEEEAFLIASRRLGGASELNVEFTKADSSTGWQKHAIWMLNGGIMFHLGVSLVPAFTKTLSSFFIIGNLGATMASTFIFGITLLGWVIFLALGYKIAQRKVSATQTILLLIAMLFVMPIMIATEVIQHAILSPEQIGNFTVAIGIPNFFLRYVLLIFLAASLWIISKQNSRIETNLTISS